MFDRLQKKWKVSGWRLLLILMTFAIGGSLTGYIGRRAMNLIGIENGIVFFPVYIIIITIIWPIMVLLISIPLGQFFFFKRYITRLAGRIGFGRISNSEQGMANDEPILNRAEGIANIEQGMWNDEKNSNITGRRAFDAGNEQQTSNFKPRTSNQKSLVIFASGAGSNAQRIIDHFRNSPIVKVDLIVCNKPGAGVIGIADKENIPLLMIEKERFFRGDAYLPELKGADLIVLAGFLWKIPQKLIDAFAKRIVNIHPALLPRYGGKGMYGQYVHEAVIQAGDVQSGITIHYVDEHYDNGDIIFQTACPVMEGDDPETLAKRIHQLEHVHYPKVIEEVVEGLGIRS